MKKLVSSSEAAQALGLSLQGIHYRIKKGQLSSIKKDGKIFVYIDSSQIKTNSKLTMLSAPQMNDLLVKSKDEQILTLKKTIKFMKKQYTSEIDRLDKNQNKIMSIFQSEVDLLKSAFHEMKSIYQIDHKKEEKAPMHKIGLPFMDLKDFFVFMKNYNKTDLQIKGIILNQIKLGDKRFVYKKYTKEVLIYKNDFSDLI